VQSVWRDNYSDRISFWSTIRIAELNAIMKFAGSMDGDSKDMSSQEIKSSRWIDYYDK